MNDLPDSDVFLHMSQALHFHWPIAKEGGCRTSFVPRHTRKLYVFAALDLPNTLPKSALVVPVRRTFLEMEGGDMLVLRRRISTAIRKMIWRTCPSVADPNYQLLDSGWMPSSEELKEIERCSPAERRCRPWEWK
jgi:hypothetical protein